MVFDFVSKTPIKKQESTPADSCRSSQIFGTKMSNYEKLQNRNQKFASGVLSILVGLPHGFDRVKIFLKKRCKDVSEF